MAYKIMSFCVIFFIVSLSCIGQELGTTKSFPEQISLSSIHNYIERKINLPPKELHQEYRYILNYLERCVSVYAENIQVSLTGEPQARAFPILIDGRLDFAYDDDFILAWRETSNEWSKRARDNTVSEIFDLLCVYNTYNQLIDHWFLMTGDILEEKYDIGKEIEDIMDIIKKYDNGSITVSDIPFSVLWSDD